MPRPSLTQQLKRSRANDEPPARAGEALEAEQPAQAKMSKPPRKGGRSGQVNFAAWGPPEGKYALEEIALERKRALGRRVSLQELMYEAMNDFLMKEGRPALFPTKEES